MHFVALRRAIAILTAIAHGSATLQISGQARSSRKGTLGQLVDKNDEASQDMHMDVSATGDINLLREPLARSEQRDIVQHHELELTSNGVEVDELEKSLGRIASRQSHNGASPLEMGGSITGAFKAAQPNVHSLLDNIKTTWGSFWTGVLQQRGVQPDYSHDWLYGYSKTVCGEENFDMSQYSISSRMLLALLYVGIVLAIVVNGRARGDTLESLPDDREQEATHRRYDLDYARILCVSCVVWDHSGGWHWTEHNFFFSQQWVLPFLYLTSGASFMMSHKSLWIYASRLLAVLVVGVSANLVADLLTGRDWRGVDTIFQMFYVVVLIVFSLIAAPLRHALRLRMSDRNVEHAWWLCASTFVFGVLTGIGFAFFMSGHSFSSSSNLFLGIFPERIVSLISNAPLAVIQVAGALLLCHIACLFRATDLLGWLLLLHMYLPRLVIPYAGVGFPHNIELLVFAMVVQSWKLRGRRAISEMIHGYWPLFIFVLLLLSCADMQGRCDLLPASSIWERFRFYSIELALCLCLCTESFKVGDPCSFKATEWLNSWALYAYCFHVAWARLFRQPYGGVLTYGSCVFFYCWTKCKGSRPDVSKSKDSEVIHRSQSQES